MHCIAVFKQVIVFHLPLQMEEDQAPGAEDDVKEEHKSVGQIRAERSRSDHLEKAKDVELQIIQAARSVKEPVDAQEEDEIDTCDED